MDRTRITPFSETDQKIRRLSEITGTPWDESEGDLVSSYGPFVFLVRHYDEEHYRRRIDGDRWSVQIRTALGAIPGWLRGVSEDEDPIEVFEQMWTEFGEALPPSLTE